MKLKYELFFCLLVFTLVSFLGFCHEPPNHLRNRLLLITGCSRSGTSFTTLFLQANGLQVEHEIDGRDGIVSWIMAVDSKTTPWETPWGPGSRDYRFKHIFHQVRNPLKTIASVSNEPFKAWKYITAYIPQIKMEDPPLVKAAKYWIYWNQKAEKKAEWTYRLEDIDKKVEEMSKRLGIPLNKELLAQIPKDTNTRHFTTQCTWTQLKTLLDADLYHKLTRLAKRYGYPTTDIK